MKCDVIACAKEATQVLLFYCGLIHAEIRPVPVCDDHRDFTGIGPGICFQKRIVSVDEFIALEIMLS